MASKMKHYKFIALMWLTRWGITLPLRFSIWENVGVLMFITGVILALHSDGNQNKLCLGILLTLLGFFLGCSFMAEIYKRCSFKEK